MDEDVRKLSDTFKKLRLSEENFEKNERMTCVLRNGERSMQITIYENHAII